MRAVAVLVLLGQMFWFAFVISARAPKLESFGPCCLNQDGHDFINAFVL